MSRGERDVAEALADRYRAVSTGIWLKPRAGSHRPGECPQQRRLGRDRGRCANSRAARWARSTGTASVNCPQELIVAAARAALD